MTRLPKSLTRVTTFSKLIAFFVILGFMVSAFYAGFLFNQKYSSVLSSITPTPTPSSSGQTGVQSGPTPVVSAQTSCNTDSDCMLTTANTQNSCCPNTRCLNFADSSTIAVNSKWLESQKSSVCGQHYMCPMIMAVCTRQITEENAHYSAKCVQHVCTKVRS